MPSSTFYQASGRSEEVSALRPYGALANSYDYKFTPYGVRSSGQQQQQQQQQQHGAEVKSTDTKVGKGYQGNFDHKMTNDTWRGTCDMINVTLCHTFANWTV
jgi:hypothetical protein